MRSLGSLQSSPSQQYHRYDASVFADRVKLLCLDDHNPAPLLHLRELVTAVRAWLGEAEDNVVAVHCKGGKHNNT